MIEPEPANALSCRKGESEGLAVRNLLLLSKPELFTSRSGVLAQGELDQLITQLTSGRSVASMRRRLQYLERHLTSAQRRGWTTPRIPEVFDMPREPSRTVDLPRGVLAADRLEQHLAAHLELRDDAAAQQGQILVSAVLNGGLVDDSWWQPFLDALAGHRFGIADRLHLELERPLARSEHYGEEIVDRRRWFADALTEVLVLRWYNGRPTAAPLAVAVVLRAYAPGEIRIARELRRAAISRLRLRVPSFIGAWTEGQVRATCATSGAMVRLATNRPLASTATREAGLEEDDRETTSSDWRVRRAPAGSIGKQLAGLRTAVNSAPGRTGKRTPAHSAQAVARLIKREGGQLHEIVRLLAKWTEDMLRERSDRAGGRTLPYAVGTVRTYLSAIGPDLAAFVTDASIADWSAAELAEVYDQVIAAAPSAADARRRAIAINLFHDCLCRGLPGSFAPLVVHGPAGLSLPADANLVTAGDWKRAKAILRTDPDKRLRRLRAFAMILARRGGLRRSEVWKLQLSDLRGRGHETQLYVCNTRFNRLKYAASRRIVPIGLLLDPDELKLMELLRDMRREEVRERRGATPRALMFTQPGAIGEPIEEGILFGPIREALRRATGDPDVTFHHLRHTMATEMLALFVLHDTEDAGGELPGLGLDTASRIRARRVCASYLGATGSRASLHLLSMLLGHQDTTTTLASYVHLVSWLLAVLIDRPEGRPQLGDKALAALEPPWKFRQPRGSGDMNRLDVLRSAWRKGTQMPRSPLPELAERRGRPRTRREREPQGRPLPSWRRMHAVLFSDAVNDGSKLTHLGVDRRFKSDPPLLFAGGGASPTTGGGLF